MVGLLYLMLCMPTEKQTIRCIYFGCFLSGTAALCAVYRDEHRSLQG